MQYVSVKTFSIYFKIELPTNPVSHKSLSNQSEAMHNSHENRNLSFRGK